VNHHTLAAISVAGTCLDVLGSLYLAYDLLGGQHGPLRLLTRAVTYTIVFGIGYGIGLGLFFGVACGVTTGVTVAIELQRHARSQAHYSLRWEALFSAIRGLGFAAGLYLELGLPFAMVFGALITAGQIAGYTGGMRPSLDYSTDLRPRMTRRLLEGSILRTLGYILAALLCGAVVRPVEHICTFALHVGIVTGLVTTVGMVVTPYIEYYADRMPERRLGVFGIALLLCGFALQSLQYWLALFDVRVV
jgi:hypothetical protein